MNNRSEKIEALARELYLRGIDEKGNSGRDSWVAASIAWDKASALYAAAPADIATEPDASRPYVELITREAAQVACSGVLTDMVACYFVRPNGDGTSTLEACHAVASLLEDWRPGDGPFYVIKEAKKEGEG
tara:strand:- start:650 stop:1042 length:393 start_codon:yes stop_codon:yes gene_type:complete